MRKFYYNYFCHCIYYDAVKNIIKNITQILKNIFYCFQTTHRDDVVSRRYENLICLLFKNEVFAYICPIIKLNFDIKLTCRDVLVFSTILKYKVKNSNIRQQW